MSGDLLIYYEQGNPRKCVAPDVFVVKGAPDHRRMIYKLWEEPKAPDFVLEVASRNTWKEDLGPKRATYAAMGVREYWLFDPKDECFDPQLQGLVLEDGVYRSLPARVEAGRRTLSSAELGLDLQVEGGKLRFRGWRERRAVAYPRRARDAARRRCRPGGTLSGSSGSSASSPNSANSLSRVARGV